MVRFVKSPLHASTSSKRILANSSLSPLHEGKKTKTFTSPNCYAVLTTVDISDDTVFDATLSPSRDYTVFDVTLSPFRDYTVVHLSHPMDLEDLAPPLYISNIINFSAFNYKLRPPSPTYIKNG
jgi:hypothetical protein